MSGAKVGFYGGNIKKLMDDVKELKPTLLIAVPRILYRIYDKASTCSVCLVYVNTSIKLYLNSFNKVLLVV